MNQKVDWKKVFFAIATLVSAVFLTNLLHPYIHNNQDAINVIVTVFSILAGFLVAVITLIGDPQSLPQGSWQVAQLGSARTYNRLTRKKWLFILYLLTLTLVFLSVLIKGNFPDIEPWLEKAYLFLAISALILSFRLPSALMQLQQERIEQEIEHRRACECIRDEHS